MNRSRTSHPVWCPAFRRQGERDRLKTELQTSVRRAFTLIELLTVIAIIGIVAAIVAPSLTNFRKGDAMLSATRQMLDEVAYARQLAISTRSTVYMVFVPTNFWDDDAYKLNGKLSDADRRNATNLVEKQLNGYNFISLRSVGDQPGRGTPRYLSQWRALPESTFLALQKFAIPDNSFYTIPTSPPNGFQVYGFNTTTDIPFPSVNTTNYTVARPYPRLPYIAFDYLGRLASGRDEYIPLAHGSYSYARNANKVPIFNTGSVNEVPPGNSIKSYNIIHIDYLTGRARLEHQELQ